MAYFCCILGNCVVWNFILSFLYVNSGTVKGVTQKKNYYSLRDQPDKISTSGNTLHHVHQAHVNTNKKIKAEQVLAKSSALSYSSALLTRDNIKHASIQIPGKSRHTTNIKTNKAC